MEPLAAIQAAASRHPARPALVSGGQALAYAELLEAAGRLARRLPAGTLALRMANAPEAVVAALAAMGAGADLLLLDASLKAAEVEEACARAGATALLVRRGEVAGDLGCIEVPPPAELLAEPAEPGMARHPATPGGFLLLSSGTTGTPKVVHRTAAQAAAAVDLFRDELPCGPEDRILALMPFCHSFGLLFVLLGGLGAGACLVLEPFSPRGTAATVAREGITVLPATPFMFRLLAETSFDPTPDFTGLRYAVSAGSGLPAGVASAFLARFGVPVLQSYGSTETGPVALSRPGQAGVGRPYGCVEILLGRDGNPEPILVRSPGRAEGYRGDPAASAEVFRPDGVAIGDLGYLDADGHVVVTGRDRPLLSVGGKKVSPAEVEACLKTHPAIADAVVVGVPAADGGHLLKAVLLADPGLTPQAVQAHVAARLALFKVPREIQFAGAGDQTSLGKLRYHRHP